MWITSRDFKILFEAASPLEKMILALGGTMGLRRTELASVRLDDISGNSLTVTGKGVSSGKIIEMEMSGLVSKVLPAYLKWRQEILSKFGDRSEGYLLINPYEKHTGKRLSPSVLTIIALRLRDKTGVIWTLHSLRRLYCMTMVDAGVELDTTRRMMRHSSVNTTINAYIKADPRKLHKAMSAVDDTFSVLMG